MSMINIQGGNACQVAYPSSVLRCVPDFAPTLFLSRMSAEPYTGIASIDLIRETIMITYLHQQCNTTKEQDILTYQVRIGSQASFMHWLIFRVSRPLDGNLRGSGRIGAKPSPPSISALGHVRLVFSDRSVQRGGGAGAL